LLCHPVVFTSKIGLIFKFFEILQETLILLKPFIAFLPFSSLVLVDISKAIIGIEQQIHQGCEEIVFIGVEIVEMTS